MDGDRTAAIIAGALKADKLILLTDVEGLMLKGERVPKIAATEVKEVLSKIGGGMSTKVHAGLGSVKPRRQRSPCHLRHSKTTNYFSFESSGWYSDN